MWVSVTLSDSLKPMIVVSRLLAYSLALRYITEISKFSLHRGRTKELDTLEIHYMDYVSAGTHMRITHIQMKKPAAGHAVTYVILAQFN